MSRIGITTGAVTPFNPLDKEWMESVEVLLMTQEEWDRYISDPVEEWDILHPLVSGEGCETLEEVNFLLKKICDGNEKLFLSVPLKQ